MPDSNNTRHFFYTNRCFFTDESDWFDSAPEVPGQLRQRSAPAGGAYLGLDTLPSITGITNNVAPTINYNFSY